MLTSDEMSRTCFFLLVVIRAGAYCQSNYGPSASFNDFINENSILNNTATNPLAGSPSHQHASSASPSSSSSVSLIGRNEERLYRMRQRSRNHRLRSLRFQILQRLGMDQPPSLTVSPEARNRVMETLDRFPAFAEPLEQEELDNMDRRCYSASCEIPHKVNESLWRNISNLGLRLFVPVPRDRSSEGELQSGTLHLFLKPNPMGYAQCDCDSEEEAGGENSNCRSASGLLVQVYQYVRPLSIRRRGRVVNRRRLLDAKFVPVSGNTWISFNIRNVAAEWRRHRRNFGVEVTVKDDNETAVDAKSMFVPPDCTVGREIGCREGSGNDNEAGLHFPWPVSYSDNFPYLDLTAVRQGGHTSRPRRSPRHGRGRLQNVTGKSAGVQRAAPRESRVQPTSQSRTRESCRGKRISVPIKDANVVKPRFYTSMMCPQTCWDCPHGQKQCTSRRCLPPKTEPVVGHYRSENSPSVALPYSRIIACGC